MAGLVLDGKNLSLSQACAVARRPVSVEVAPAARDRVRAARAQVERTIGRDKAVYGLNTGFGKLANTRSESGPSRRPRSSG